MCLRSRSASSSEPGWISTVLRGSCSAWSITSSFCSAATPLGILSRDLMFLLEPNGFASLRCRFDISSPIVGSAGVCSGSSGSFSSPSSLVLVYRYRFVIAPWISCREGVGTCACCGLRPSVSELVLSTPTLALSVGRGEAGLSGAGAVAVEGRTPADLDGLDGFVESPDTATGGSSLLRRRPRRPARVRCRGT